MKAMKEVHVTVRFDEQHAELLEIAARQLGKTRSDVIRKAVDLFLQKDEYIACAATAIESVRKFQELVASK